MTQGLLKYFCVKLFTLIKEEQVKKMWNDVFHHKLKKAVNAPILLHYFAELRHALATSVQCSFY